MSTPETRAAILRLMRYASTALEAKWQHDAVKLANLRTSADDCRIAIRATTEPQCR
jgi:hypothetical protein